MATDRQRMWLSDDRSVQCRQLSFSWPGVFFLHPGSVLSFLPSDIQSVGSQRTRIHSHWMYFPVAANQLTLSLFISFSPFLSLTTFLFYALLSHRHSNVQGPCTQRRVGTVQEHFKDNEGKEECMWEGRLVRREGCKTREKYFHDSEEKSFPDLVKEGRWDVWRKMKKRHTCRRQQRREN